MLDFKTSSDMVLENRKRRVTSLHSIHCMLYGLRLNLTFCFTVVARLDILKIIQQAALNKVFTKQQFIAT